jgi:hypothetical protein
MYKLRLLNFALLSFLAVNPKQSVCLGQKDLPLNVLGTPNNLWSIDCADLNALSQPLCRVEVNLSSALTRKEAQVWGVGISRALDGRV